MAKKSPPPGVSRLLNLLLCLVIVLSGFIILSQYQTVSGSAPASKSQSWITLNSQFHNFTFTYPPDWKIWESQNEVSVIEPNSAFGFTIMPINNFPKPEKYFEDLKTNKTFTVESESSIKIGDLNTIALIDNSADYSQYMLYSLHDKTLFTVVFLSDNTERLSTITRILSTFKLKP